MRYDVTPFLVLVGFTGGLSITSPETSTKSVVVITAHRPFGLAAHDYQIHHRRIVSCPVCSLFASPEFEFFFSVLQIERDPTTIE